MPKGTNIVWVPSEEEIEIEKRWIEGQIVEIGMAKIEELVQTAQGMLNKAYSPYSGYKVGAALLAASGKIYTGVNIEIASYSETGHGEEDAAKVAVMAGEVNMSGRRFIKAIAISHPSDTAPCGRCRQILVEFCDNCLVIVANVEGKINRITSLKTLLPYAFSPSDLGKD